jgi:hypothetical protein
MDFITHDEARRNIVALGLPQIVLDAFDNKPLPYNLDLQFQQPYAILTLGPDEQAGYGHGRITPIWTGGGENSIVAYHHAPQRQGFFRFDIETAEEQQPIRLSWQQILVKEFKSLWESEMPDERLREIAGWFGFKYVESLIAELPPANLDSFEKDVAWYQSFLRRIAG